ncbi:pseudouridylate synthase RPUSD2-like isoform X3 [Topomyia yanbarensis]|uniref:pseudouridylate synthase RPUSD2-like isoform X3 n=1 Tax=Topomyia yanbarensis TaxID=2498891 RepID=UPI00273AE0BB|nr:pseudouridylate synthase RPUSD2-like isoform X3 [Topomyia yanbarensis]
MLLRAAISFVKSIKPSVFSKSLAPTMEKQCSEVAVAGPSAIKQVILDDAAPAEAGNQLFAVRDTNTNKQVILEGDAGDQLFVFRNANTQHGDYRSVDEENIVVLGRCWSPQPKPLAEGETEPQVVWFEKFEPLTKEQIIMSEKDKTKLVSTEKRKADESEPVKDLKKAKLETKALKAKRPGFTDERYHETSYYIENGLRKVYPYYFTFTTFTKGRWVGEKILDVFAREFRAHPAEEYERCIKAGTLTVNYEKVPTDYRLKHNDLLANIVHRHEVPVTSQPITIVHMDDDIVVVNKPASIPVHPCGRYRHNTVVFILAKEYNLKNLRTIHRLDRLTSGLLLFGRSPKKARQMEHQIRNRQVQKEYICRVEGEFPDGIIECKEPIEVVSYKIGVCKVSPKGKECTTYFQKLGYNGTSSVVQCKPRTGRMHQIRVHLQYLGFPVVNDPLYNHEVFGPVKGRGGDIGGKSDEQLVKDLINIHNAENWLGIDGDSELSMFKPMKNDLDDGKGPILSDDDSESVSREASPCSESPRPVSLGSESPNENMCASMLAPNALNVVGSANTGSSNSNNNSSVALSNRLQSQKVTVATQTGHESPDLAFNPDKMTTDKHCYECKVRYRDPKPQDLVMYLHAWKYKGPGWDYETELPEWARVDWPEHDFE